MRRSFLEISKWVERTYVFSDIFAEGKTLDFINGI
jgi:hypothetical protein